jgi:hypothetical protein
VAGGEPGNEARAKWNWRGRALAAGCRQPLAGALGGSVAEDRAEGSGGGGGPVRSGELPATPALQSTRRARRPFYGRSLTSPVSPGPRQDLRCPKCGLDDQVHRVSAVHAAAFRPSTPDVRAAAESGALSDSEVNAARALQRPGRVTLLPPPPPPRGASRAVGAVVGGLSGMFVGFVAAQIHDPGFDFSPVIIGLMYVVGGGILGAVVVRAIVDRSTIESIEAAGEGWRRQLAAWNRLYYCARDDAVFEPGRRPAVAAKYMMTLVEEIAGREIRQAG